MLTADFDPLRTWFTPLVLRISGPCRNDVLSWLERNMRRRDFLALAVGAVGVLPVESWAQRTTTIPRVGVLWHAGSAEEEAVQIRILSRPTLMINSNDPGLQRN
jgi:hypothetical protein